jgi:hypothetical protein
MVSRDPRPAVEQELLKTAVVSKLIRAGTRPSIRFPKSEPLVEFAFPTRGRDLSGGGA